MYEKKYKAISPQNFISDGTSNGALTILHPALFKVKMSVRLSGTALQDLDVEIKRIESDGTIYVGPLGGSIDQRSDVSAYTVAANATISLVADEKRPNITADAFERAVYEEEPTVAKRVIPVDPLGNLISEDNPLPIITGSDWDQLLIARDSTTQDITSVTYKKNGAVIRVETLSYDANENLIEVDKT